MIAKTPVKTTDQICRRYLVNKPVQAAGIMEDNAHAQEIVGKQTFASRPNVTFYKQSLSKWHYPPIFQKTRKEYIYYITGSN